MHQQIRNFRFVGQLLLVVLLAGVFWWASPSVYQSVQTLLPDHWRASVSSDYSQTNRRIGELETQLQQLRSQNRRLQAKTQATNNQTLPDNGQIAEVIARPPQTPYDTLLVSVPDISKASVGAGVWWPTGSFLGEVIDKRSDAVLVRLVSSSGVTHSARIADRLTLRVTGRGGGMMTAPVPPKADVSSGALVVSDRYAVPIGRVAKVREAASIPQQRLFIRPTVPASVIEQVYVQSQ